MPDADKLSENTKVVYQQLCDSYRAIDEFRTKLLGFLPLASGGFFILLADKAKLDAIDSTTASFIGLFGIAVAFGLFCFELYGIRKCTVLIYTGKLLELQLGQLTGQFGKRPDGIFGYINEPFAAGIIYPAVMAAWAFVALSHGKCAVATNMLSAWLAIAVFACGFVFSLLFIRWLQKNEIPRLVAALGLPTS